MRVRGDDAIKLIDGFDDVRGLDAEHVDLVFDVDNLVVDHLTVRLGFVERGLFVARGKFDELRVDVVDVRLTVNCGIVRPLPRDGADLVRR